MTAVMVRQAGAQDLAAIARLRRASAQEQDGEQADPGFEGAFASWFVRETSRRIFWLAEADGQPVGSMNLMVFDRMPRPGRRPSGWGYLGNAFVLAPRRNQGIGRLLLAAVLEFAADHRLARVVLSPSERSIPFYRRAGFRSADELLVWTPGPVALADGLPWGLGRAGLDWVGAAVITGGAQIDSMTTPALSTANDTTMPSTEPSPVLRLSPNSSMPSIMLASGSTMSMVAREAARGPTAYAASASAAEHNVRAAYTQPPAPQAPVGKGNFADPLAAVVDHYLQKPSNPVLNRMDATRHADLALIGREQTLDST